MGFDEIMFIHWADFTNDLYANVMSVVMLQQIVGFQKGWTKKEVY